MPRTRTPTTAQLLKVFVALGGSTLPFTEDWIKRLERLGSDCSQVSTLLAHYGVDLRGNPLYSELCDLYRLLVYAHAYHIAAAILVSRREFSTELTLFVGLNENFHLSNLFHGPVNAIINLISSASDMVYVSPPWISKERRHFQRDRLHLSAGGAEGKYSAIKNMVRICNRSLRAGVPHHLIMEEINGHFAQKQTRLAQNFRPSVFGPPWQPPLMTPDDRCRHRQAQRYFYRPQGSGKKMAVWSAKTETHLAPGKSHLYVLHGTSLQRDLIDGNGFSRRGRQKNNLLRAPATVTVSPGATGFTMSQDLPGYVRNLDGKRVTALMSLFYLGTNEKLQFVDLIDLLLHNAGKIGQGRCAVCKRQKKAQQRRKKWRKRREEDQARPDHKLPASLLRFLEKF